MKKLLLLSTVLVLSFLGATLSQAQTPDYLNQAYSFIEKEYGLTRKSIGELKVRSQYITDHNQVQHVHLVQTFEGIEIFGTEINLAIQKNGNVSSVGHQLTMVDQFPVERKHTSISASEAITIAAASLGMTGRSAPSLKKITPNGIEFYDKSDVSLQDIPVELGYLYTSTGEYLLVYKMQIESAGHGELYLSFVDATTGQSIVNDGMTLRCSFENGYLEHSEDCNENNNAFTSPPSPPANVPGQYRVLPVSIESPNHGGFELLTGVDDPLASPFGWHDANGVAGEEYTYTRGNNVHAFLDRNWDYSSDLNVDGGAGLIFDFPYDDNAEPMANQNVAATNLFYWNNIIHDYTFQYGFNEVAGNFQAHNYSGLGNGGDFVNALAQFGDNNPSMCGADVNGGTDCLNNADFSTPVDGLSGRMRMFTWNRDNSSKFLDILEPVDLAGKILTGVADFGPTISTTPVTGEVIVIDDGTFNGSKGCEPVTGQPELAGKIALIDRGLCDFSLKVFNAQEAGAIGVIICNFEDATIGMGAGDMAEFVTIPAVFISSVECERIRIAAGQGLVASIVSPGTGGPTFRDGALDNSVIAHEYGHGISNRLTGGPDNTSCLAPNAVIGEAEESHGMGEGWSDFFALIATVQPGDTGDKRRGIGTYANKEPTNGRGIRTYPYTTDMTINPHTYDNVLLEGLPHGVGSVWCAMLWDLYWAFSDAYGWDPDLYHGIGGNNTAIQLVIDGLKMQPCNPGFIDARDAILQADMINNGGANQCLIWSVFARRGLGANADGGDPDSRSDGKEGFDLPIACLNEITISKTMTPEVVAGNEIDVAIKITNFKDFPLTNVVVDDPVPDGCTYIAGSANIEPIVGGSLQWNISSLAPDEELYILYQLRTDPAKNSVRMLYDDIEGSVEDRWEISYDEDGTVDNFWFPQNLIVRSGESAFGVGDVATESQHFLQNIQPYTISGEYPVYRFYHYYDTEAGADGGFLEISTDDGESWYPFDDEIFKNGYPRKLQYTTFAIPNLNAYSGISSDNQEMIPAYIDLTDFIGQDVKIRYRFGTDDNTPGNGWYVDDVEIMDAVLYNSQVCMDSDESDPICAEAPARGTIVDTEISIGTEELSGDLFALMPNPAGNLVQIVMDSDQSDEAQVCIYDLTGHMFFSGRWGLTEGINQTTLDLSRYTPGMYIIQVITDNGMRSEKLVKE